MSLRDAAGEPVHDRFIGQSSFASRGLVHAATLIKVDVDLPLATLPPFGCGVVTGAGAALNSLRVQAAAAGGGVEVDLIDMLPTAGVGVSLEVQGDRRPLPASVDLAAFRIVQESLTNIVRHPEASSAKVQLTCGSGDLILQIDDDGRGPGAKADGGSGDAGAGDGAR